MAANDMSNALKKSHHDVPFAQVGDDTIAALTKLFQKVKAPGLSNAPAKTTGNKTPVDLEQPILTSPVQQQYQMIS
jgi:hypothetical protein